jgi:exodeoxyribonuclease VII small subunit
MPKGRDILAFRVNSGLEWIVSKTTKKKPTGFEEKLAELEQIVRRLESDELPLEKALEDFEKGVALSRECRTILDQARKKIGILLKDAKGGLIEEDFDPGRDPGDDEPQKDEPDDED